MRMRLLFFSIILATSLHSSARRSLRSNLEQKGRFVCHTHLIQCTQCTSEKVIIKCLKNKSKKMGAYKVKCNVWGAYLGRYLGNNNSAIGA